MSVLVWITLASSLLAACSDDDGAPADERADAGGSDGGSTEPRGLPPGPALDEDTIADFAETLQGVLDDVVFAYLEEVAGEDARALSLQTLRSDLPEHESSGELGAVVIQGARYARSPARYELSIDFQGYSADGETSFDGPVEIDFVLDGTADPARLFGMYRGALALGGRFGGAIDVRAATGHDETTALHVTGDDELDLRHGGEVPPFVAYVSTIAGSGEAGAADGQSDAATFDRPTGIAVDDEGVVYIADSANSAIREIDLDGQVTTLATSGDFALLEPFDVDFDSDGKLVISDRLHGGHGMEESPLQRLIVRGDARGTLSPIVSGIGNELTDTFPLCPISQSCDGRSPLAQSPWTSGIDAQGQSVLVAQTALPPLLRLVLPDGYVTSLTEVGVFNEITCGPDSLGAPQDVAKGFGGDLYFTSHCHAVMVMGADGEIRILAGRVQTELDDTDGVGSEARFAYPTGLVFDDERYLYVADHSNAIVRRVDVETGETLRVAGCRANVEGFNCNSSSGLVDGPGDDALFDGPHGVALDRFGDLYLVDDRNHTVRLIRIFADPEREPSVHRFEPAVVQQGDEGTLTLLGRNLATLQSIELGNGITATVEEAGYRRATATLTVADDAEPEPRSVTVTTAYGEVTTGDDLQLSVLADTRGGIQVETIAGNGEDDLDSVNYGLAQNTTFAFPGGMHAISEDRLLIADPVEQRIRLIATRTGAVEEVFELLTYAASGVGVDPLGGIIGVFDGIEQVLGTFGLGSGIIGQSEGVLRMVAEATVDDICDTLGADDCTWLSLPWSGLPYAPGDEDGFRLNARYFIPTDIWADPKPAGVNSHFYVADSGNATIRIIGYDVDSQADAPMQVFTTDQQPSYPYAVTLDNTSVYASVPSEMALSQLSLSSGAVNGDYGAIARSAPLGIATYDGSSATDERSIFVADPLNATIYRVINNGGVAEVKDIRGDFPSVIFGDCVDGPAAFATWGAPMDVAIDQTGTVYVADSGCNSIRVIQDAGFGQDLDGVVDGLRAFVAANQSRISVATAQRIEEALRGADTTFLDDHRFMVRTLAGSTDAQAGYRDGQAAIARFDSPTSLAVATTGAGKVIFVADTGNHRIRRIVIP